MKYDFDNFLKYTVVWVWISVMLFKTNKILILIILIIFITYILFKLIKKLKRINKRLKNEKNKHRRTKKCEVHKPKKSSNASIKRRTKKV